MDEQGNLGCGMVLVLLALCVIAPVWAVYLFFLLLIMAIWTNLK